MASNNETTTKFRVDISELKKSMQEAKRQITLANSEFKAASSALDDWTKSTDGISAKLTQLDTTLQSQKTILSSLEKEYELTVQQFGEGSKAADDLKIKILNQKAAINKTEKDVSKYNKELDELGDESKDASKESKKAAKSIEELADSADQAEQSTGGLSDSLGGLVKGGLASIGAGVAGLVGGFLASGEATKEFTTAMGKLETAFTTNGFTVAEAQKSYDGLVGILGETDQAVETANHLAKLVDTEKELEEWTNICTGVYATFGDSLPIEGLTEAANETAKVGQVTGPLADALNWAGVSEDKFNAALAECTTEQERQALITKTLTGLYSEASEAYQQTNADIIASNKATSDLNAAMAEVGKVAMPIMTAFKQMGATLLTELMPNVQELGGAFQGLITGTDGAAEQMGTAVSNLLTTVIGKIAETLPTLTATGVSLIGSLLTSLTDMAPDIISVASDVILTLAEGFLSMLPQLVTTFSVIVTSLLASLGELLPQIVTAIIEIVPQLIDSLIAAIPLLLEGAITFLMAIVDALPTIIESLVAALPQLITTITNFLIAAIPQLIEGAITLLMAIVDALPTIIQALTEALPDVINAIVDALIIATPLILEGAITLFMAIVDALPEIIEKLVPELGNLVKSAVSALIENLPKILKGAITLFMAIVQAIPTIVKELVKVVPTIATAIINGLKNLASDLWTETLKPAINKFVNFASEAKDKAVKAGKEILNGVIDTVKDLPSEIKEIGGDVVKGLWDGINNMTSWVIGKIEGFGDSVLGGIKSFFGIHSPSRVMKNEIGKPIAEGVAEGIKEKKYIAVKAAQAMGEDVVDSSNKTLAELDKARDGSLAAELAYWNAMNDVAKDGAKEQTKAVSTVAKAEKELLDNVSDLLDNYVSEMRSVTDSLMGSCDLFETVEKNTEVKSDDLLSNLEAQVKAYGEYWKTVTELKGRITSDGLNAAIDEMGVDSLGELQALNAMTDEQLAQYSQLYDTKYAVCNEIAKTRLAGLRTETEMQLAGMLGVTSVNLDEFTAIFNGSMDSITQYIAWSVNKTAELETDMVNAGNMIMQGLITGMDSKLEDLRAVVENIISTAAEAAKAAADIHSPSRLFANEIGKFIPLGIAKGITDNTDSVTGALNGLTAQSVKDAKSKLAGNLQSNIVSGAGAGVGGAGSSSTVVNNNYNQTINSPTALSRLEIYRQSKNLFNFAGGRA